MTAVAHANSLPRWRPVRPHIDTSILGIGERNGITPLGGLVARLYSYDKDLEEAQTRMLYDLINIADIAGSRFLQQLHHGETSFI
jgi:homocitrate synthase